VASLGRLALGGSLLGPLAHELNNFVQGLLAVIYLFQDCLEAGDPIEPDLVEDLRLVVDDLAAISSGIQNFARQEVAGSEPVELGKVIDQAAALLRSSGKLKTVELSVNVSTEVPRLFWPKAELDFLILAILSNAADAASVSPGDQAVQIECAGSDAFFTLEFKDSGAGLNLAESATPFVSTGPAHRNLGLGLSIASAIISSHGGSISAEKHEETNVVRVTLPLATEATAERAQ
jgi:two-component system C4-dicarboxylate transport sensor histidine kinase DctB